MCELEQIKTKKELKKVVKSLLLQCPTEELIVWLLKRHPNKEKLKHLVPTMYFLVIPDRTGAPKLIVNGDTISWVSCVNKRIVDGCAFRDEVRDYMCDVRRSTRAEEYVCHICREKIENQDFTLDHIPSFKSLKTSFVDANGTAELDESTEDYRFKDRTYASKWYDYHKRNSQLLPAHGKCNTRRYHATK